MTKTLVFLCGPNGIGKTTIGMALMRRLPGSAYVDTDPCRTMNPAALDDVTIPTIAANIACLIRNYLWCDALETVIFSYGFHGRRREVFDAVMRALAGGPAMPGEPALAGVPFDFLPLLLTCDEAENVRRMRADGRDPERIQRALEHSRPAYAGVDYPRIDITRLSAEEAAAAILVHLHRT